MPSRIADENDGARDDASDQDARGADRAQNQAWILQIDTPFDEYQQRFGTEDSTEQREEGQIEQGLFGQTRAPGHGA